MASTLRIRRRITGASGAPSSLKNAELAYNEIDNILYYGKGDNGAGTATSVIQISGSGAFATTSYVDTNFAKLGASNSFTVGFTNTFAGTLNVSGTFQLSGTSVTATAADINKLAGITAGTALASKALILDSSRNISNINSLTSTTLQNGNSSFTVASNGATVALSVAAGTINIAAGAFTASDSAAAFTTSLTASSFATTGSGNITAAGDLIATGNAYALTSKKLATEEYVNSVQQGLDVKQSVRAATTEAITLSGTQTIDDVPVGVGQRVLVKDQVGGVANGIYVVALGTWTRATDANTNTNVTAGLFTFVEEGTQNADSGWILTADAAITVGTTNLTFVQFSGAGGITIDGSSTASVTHGLEKDGNYLRLDVRLKRIADLTGVTANKLIYVNGTDTFAMTDFTSVGRSLVAGADASAMRTTLGLGTIATQAASNVSITGGAISSVTIDLVTLDGGTF